MVRWLERVSPRRRLATAGCIALAVALEACALHPDREVIGAETELGAQLGFIRAPDARRELVEARLGGPASTFEGGRIVGYAVYADRGQLSLGGGLDCYGLMIEYADDGHVVRHVLIRHGSAQCRKD